MKKIVVAKVISYDAGRGLAIIKTKKGKYCELFAGAFFSRECRLPRVGDKVKARIQRAEVGIVAVAARLIN